MRILVIDVGGRQVKVLATGRTEGVEIPSSPRMPPAKIVAAVPPATAGWSSPLSKDSLVNTNKWKGKPLTPQTAGEDELRMALALSAL